MPFERVDPVCCLPGPPRLIVVRRDGEGVDPVEARLELADAARRAFDWIGSVAVEVEGGLGWLEGGVLSDDLYSGTAGVLVGCAEAAAAGLGMARVSAGARARLLHLARHGPGVARMPGFSHGTAGVAYALAAAGRTLNRRDLVDVAARGACALLALGHHPGGWAVPHAIPPRPGGPAVAYGWCHGPAGTVRLFLLLNEIDPQPRWQHAIGACLQALRDSRLPIRPSGRCRRGRPCRRTTCAARWP
jgi:hypothetical protein